MLKKTWTLKSRHQKYTEPTLIEIVLLPIHGLTPILDRILVKRHGPISELHRAPFSRSMLLKLKNDKKYISPTRDYGSE